MELSKRLQAVADMVPIGNIVADIGCDHGYVSIYLVKNKIARKVIAMDVNEGPLARAREHIKRYGYCAYIETRLSDGANQLKVNEADAMICAGMGGKLMLRILENDATIIQKMRACILQPQSEIALVRNTLLKRGYGIVAEDIIYEEDKFYPMIRVVYVGEEIAITNKLTEVEAKYGPLLLQTRNLVLHDFLKKEELKLERIFERLSKQTNTNARKEKRIQELEHEKEVLLEAFKYYSKEEQVC